MEHKLQYIKDLFLLYTLIYSYLLLPLILVLFKVKKVDLVVVATSAVLFFALLKFHDDIPKHLLSISNTFYTSLEYAVFTTILWVNIDSKRFKRIILVSSIAFLTFQIIFYLKNTKFGLDSIPIGVESILIFIYIFYFLFEYVKNIKNQYIYINYCFWCAIGIMIYLGGNFFFNIMSNQVQSKDLVENWYLTYIPEIVKNVLFLVAIIIYHKNPISKTSTKPKSIPFLDMI